MKNFLSLDFLQHHVAPSAILLVKISHIFSVKLKDNITVLPLTPLVVIFVFLEADCQYYLIQNHILLISKLYIYKSRKSKFLSSTCLLKEISKIKNIEKKVISVNEKKMSHTKESGGRGGGN